MSGPFHALDAEHVLLRDRARNLAELCLPHAERADESDSVDSDVLQLLKESGLAAVQVPAAYGGHFENPDSLAVTVVREQLAASSSHLDSLFAMQGIGSYAISVGGSDEIKEHWLPRVAAMDAIAALALTEPDVGSDLKALTTTIAADGDEVVVTGTKSFITNGGDASYYCVLGKEEGDGVGYSLVLVPADTPGVTTSRPYQIMAPHVLGDIEFDGVRVPVSHRLGAPTKGFGLVLATLATFRVSVAGAAIGTAQAALDDALAHTTGRDLFGTSLARLGPVPQLLAMSWTEIEMARSFAYQVARAAAADPLGSLHLSSMAKIGATEIAGRVVDRSVQVMGRFGLVRGSRIERLYRAARPMRVYEGATEVLLDGLSKQLIKGHGR
ncbi:acyl-CoA dehydrogenase family protein [Geodermatophilus sabuli]|uniref:Acyl-CoA dehydrogenase n=1 Tax=Geodermatophilus sabuli TaxID=1564158 RepID=A0A285EA85_9ACTN|nr:acyl-CoA dehydrogenase family protein [Geodermatophilus sabuli]MBB3085539.1 acyl-CoA dehydrogenase [Geodermatophilus sabuli]SNX96039.1 acyl-CoA dehydrogenase [Geodermatophilus sabuli]